MKATRISCAIALALSGLSGATNAALGDLNTVPFATYGDALVTPLPIAQIVSNCVGPGCPFYVTSTPGAIKDLIVVATGTNNAPAVQNFDGMERAFQTPSGNNSANFFTTNAATNRGIDGSVQTQVDNAWDASLLSLKTFLGSEQMVFFFNNNNTNAAETQSLAIWALAWITNSAGNVVAKYELTNRGLKYALVSDGAGGGISSLLPGGIPNPLADPTLFTTTKNPGDDPLAGTNNATDYVLAGGAVCLTNQFVPVPCSDASASIGPVNLNLGANEVAYAVRVPELNALLAGLFLLGDAALGQHTFHLDLRMGCDPATVGSNNGDRDSVICEGQETPLQAGRNLNNGYEQLFIGKASAVFDTPLPEPGTLALVSGLLGILALRKRRFKLV